MQVARSSSKIFPGARTLVKLLQAHGVVVALVSGGLCVQTYWVADQLGIPRDLVRTNVLGTCRDASGRTVLDGTVAVNVAWDAKGRLVEELAKSHGIGMECVCHVGDDKNDIPAFSACGESVAVNPRNQETCMGAKHCVEFCNDFRELVSLLMPPARVLWIRPGSPEYISRGSRDPAHQGVSLTFNGESYTYIDSKYQPCVSRVYASPLKRGVRKAVELFPQFCVKLDDRLIDRLEPNTMSKRDPVAVIQAKCGPRVDCSGLDHSHVPWVGDDHKEADDVFTTRVHQFSDALVSGLKPGETVAVISHNHVVSELFGEHLGMGRVVLRDVPLIPSSMEPIFEPLILSELQGVEGFCVEQKRQEELANFVCQVLLEQKKVGVFSDETADDWQLFLSAIDKSPSVMEVSRSCMASLSGCMDSVAELLAQKGIACDVASPPSLFSALCQLPCILSKGALLRLCQLRVQCSALQFPTYETAKCQHAGILQHRRDELEKSLGETKRLFDDYCAESSAVPVSEVMANAANQWLQVHSLPQPSSTPADLDESRWCDVAIYISHATPGDLCCRCCSVRNSFGAVWPDETIFRALVHTSSDPYTVTLLVNAGTLTNAYHLDHILRAQLCSEEQVQAEVPFHIPLGTHSLCSVDECALSIIHIKQQSVPGLVIPLSPSTRVVYILSPVDSSVVLEYPPEFTEHFNQSLYDYHGEFCPELYASLVEHFGQQLSLSAWFHQHRDDVFFV